MKCTIFKALAVFTTIACTAGAVAATTSDLVCSVLVLKAATEFDKEDASVQYLSIKIPKALSPSEVDEDSNPSGEVNMTIGGKDFTVAMESYFPENTAGVLQVYIISWLGQTREGVYSFLTLNTGKDPRSAWDQDSKNAIRWKPLGENTLELSGSFNARLLASAFTKLKPYGVNSVRVENFETLYKSVAAATAAGVFQKGEPIGISWLRGCYQP